MRCTPRSLSPASLLLDLLSLYFFPHVCPETLSQGMRYVYKVCVCHFSNCCTLFQMQDVRDEIEQHDVLSHYLNPPSKQSNQVGFVVRDAPWDNVQHSDSDRKPQQTQQQQQQQQQPPSRQSTKEKPPPPDTSNIADFPCIGSSAAAPRPTAWGPTRR